MHLRPLLPLCLFAALCAACSSVPKAEYPRSVDHQIEAEFVVPDNGEFWFPASTRTRIVQQLELQPPPRGERFGGDGERWLLYAPGTRVHVHGSFRSFADDAGQLPKADEIIPGAILLAPKQQP